MSKKEQKQEMQQQEGKNPFKLHPNLVIFIFFLIATIIIFAPVLTKPMESPDSISQAYPVYQFNKTYFLKHFSLPFWYPYLDGGTPYIEGMHFNHLFDLPVYLFSIPLGIGFRAMLFVLLAGFFCYLFFNAMGFGRSLAVLAGLVYMISGDAVSYTAIGHYGKVVNMAFLPLVLLFIEKAIRERKIIYFLCAGLPFGFMMKGHPQIFFYNFLIIGVYSFFRFISEMIKTKDRKLLFTVIFGVLLFGASSVLVGIDNLVGQLNFLKMTSRGNEVDPIQKWQFATSWSLHPLELIGYLLPAVFGLQNQSYLGWRPFVSTTDYLGFIVFIVAIFGIIKNWKTSPVRILTGIMIAAVLFGFGSFFTAYYKLFYKFVPMIQSFRVPSSIYISVAFILVWFFVLGMRSIMEEKNTEPGYRKSMSFLMLSMIGTAILLTIFVNSQTYLQILKDNLGHKMDIASLVQQYGSERVDAYVTNLVSTTSSMAHSGLTSVWLLTLAFCSLLLLKVYAKLKPAVFVGLIGIIIFIDMVNIDKQFIHPTDGYEQVSKETDEIRFLKSDSDKFRIIPIPIQIDNDSNKWVFFGIESAFGYNAVGLKLYDEIQNSGLLGDLKFLGLFNVKYLVSKQLIKDPRVKPVFQGKTVIIYSNRLFMPRVSFVQTARILESGKKVLEEMRAPAFNPGKEILLEEKPMELTSPASMDKGKDSMTEMNFGLNEITMKVSVTAPKFLLLSEVFYPKWECLIDGKPTKIYKADFLFRAVQVWAGEHRIVFRYKNDGTYLLTTLVGLFASLFLIVFLIIRRKDFLS